MATGWFAAARPAIPPAVCLALVVVTSCVLPAYSVGGTTSGGAAGASTNTGPGAGGAGGAGQSSSGNASVGPGGSGIGGSGIGGDLLMCHSSSTHEEIAPGTSPHGVSVAKNHVFWIADNDDEVHYANRAASHDPKTLPIADVCGISATNFGGADRVVMRQRDGSISFVTLPFSTGMTITPVFGATAAPLDDGACAISVATNGDVYGFSVDQSGVYTVVRYQLLPPKPVQLIGAMGTPVAIDATDNDDVVWIEAIMGSGAFHAVSKATGGGDPDLPGAFTDVCAYGQKGTFAYAHPEENTIETWSQKHGTGLLASGVHPYRIACSRSHRVWIEYNGGCATLMHQDSFSGSESPIAVKQPRACSIALAGDTVYWTNCEPSGGVFAASL